MSEEGKSSRWKVWAFVGLALVIVAAAFLLQPQEQGSEGEPAALVEMGEPPVVPGEVEPFVEPADADDEGVVLVLPVPPAERDEIEAEAERMMDLPLVPQAIGTEGMVGPPVEPDEIEAEGGLGRLFCRKQSRRKAWSSRPLSPTRSRLRRNA